MSKVSPLLDDLVQQNWAVLDHCLADEAIEQLRAEIYAAYKSDELNKAKIGQSLLQTESIRGDLIKWIDPTQSPSPALQSYLNFLGTLQLELNRDLQLGLKEFELHYTLYPPKRFYQRHVDQFSTKKNRRVSFILYLNDDWQINDGGLLTLFDRNLSAELANITPEANRFICFISDIPHEISMTERERLSVTGWFKTY